MTTNEQAFPQARKRDLVTREMPDEVLVYDLKTHQAHCLNQTAALVWKYCDGKNSVTDIAELVALEANTSVDEAAVWLALERLGKANLLEERVSILTGRPRLGRREAVRRMGLGTAVAVPIIMSIVAPTAMAANTCVGVQACSPNGTNGNCCTNCCAAGVCAAIGGLVGSPCTQDCQCASNGSPGGGCNTGQNKCK